jgi:hypothetical protein
MLCENYRDKFIVDHTATITRFDARARKYDRQLAGRRPLFSTNADKDLFHGRTVNKSKTVHIIFNLIVIATLVLRIQFPQTDLCDYPGHSI